MLHLVEPKPKKSFAGMIPKIADSMVLATYPLSIPQTAEEAPGSIPIGLSLSPVPGPLNLHYTFSKHSLKDWGIGWTWQWFYQQVGLSHQYTRYRFWDLGLDAGGSRQDSCWFGFLRTLKNVGIWDSGKTQIIPLSCSTLTLWLHFPPFSTIRFQKWLLLTKQRAERP